MNFQRMGPVLNLGQGSPFLTSHLTASRLCQQARFDQHFSVSNHKTRPFSLLYQLLYTVLPPYGFILVITFSGPLLNCKCAISDYLASLDVVPQPLGITFHISYISHKGHFLVSMFSVSAPSGQTPHQFEHKLCCKTLALVGHQRHQ